MSGGREHAEPSRAEERELSLTTVRWLLAPRRQWRTRRLRAAHGPTLPYETAWCLVALADDVGNLPYVRRRTRPVPSVPPGVMVDVWAQLEPAEQQRRRAWLTRHSRTPLHLLRVPEELIELAGLHVTEWALPPDVPSISLVVQQQPRPKRTD
ncbi:hypothetical protein [Streptomyces nodosus]|uniref:Uncharacterized protein n=1 Tax=Streptomyces nodosus TaxID=40318 RepID=A0A0B5DE32_9ACTN|nr:hypothetical protein [Streptomyces nodosus]AJE38711.1 hypothetical protein SNOD_00280 [Streptomyces nodosus]MBB4789422.1 hypothetical protein [Streptomyces nodosus]QEV37291.1 hypothetical protein CP978_00635 [Streptomyces nodosus]